MRHAIVVDDERFARLELRRLLEPHADAVHVVGEADDVASAAAAVRRADADVVFLDIQLGPESGFDLVPMLAPDVSIVFVTAHDAHAIRAFEVNALDYLLKPVEPERLAVTIAKLARRTPNPDVAVPLRYMDRLFLRLDDRLDFLRIASIVAIEADRDDSRVCLVDGRTLGVRKPLREWEERLPPQHFARVHRSAIVNLEYVERVEEWSHYSCRVHLRGMAEPLTMSRRFAAKLRSRLR